jgi:hypothetical protein
MSNTANGVTETEAHRNEVAARMGAVMAKLALRAQDHDASKLEEPERTAFDVVAGQLKGLTYGSDAYKANLRKIKPAIEHHYRGNSHHPEHWGRGLNDMSLLDILEMLCDWKAATLRHDDGDIMKSITHNQERFGMSDQLADILRNTVTDMGWEGRE